MRRKPALWQWLVLAIGIVMCSTGILLNPDDWHRYALLAPILLVSIGIHVYLLIRGG